MGRREHQDDAYDEGVAEGRRQFAEELAAALWPERYPPGHPAHEADHIFWDGIDLDDPEAVAERAKDVFEWSADTIEWVAMDVQKELGRDGDND